MSDNWITLIPTDARFVPERERQAKARDRLAEIVRQADEVEVECHDEVQFFDCGGNFECVRCPACRAELPVAWWSDLLAAESQRGYPFDAHTMPCCGVSATLHALVYELPQGFARFALSAMNPRIGFDDRMREQLESILGTKLLVIYRHL